MKPVLSIVLAAAVLGGCLSKVPEAERRNDPWRRTSEQLSRPITLN